MNSIAKVLPSITPGLPANVIVAAAALVVGFTFRSYYGKRRWVSGLLVVLIAATGLVQGWVIYRHSAWSEGWTVGSAAAAIVPGLATAALLVMLLVRRRGTGVRTPRASQVAILLSLRLAALAVACSALFQPYWTIEEAQPLPSCIVILIDQTKSMLVNDEERPLSLARGPGTGDERLASRWEVALHQLEIAQPAIERLKQELGVDVYVYGFDGGVLDFDGGKPPEGDRTAVLQAIEQAYERHKPFDREKSPRLLGIVVLSDFRDNVDFVGVDSAAKQAQQTLQAKLSTTPIMSILLGAPGGSQLQPDLIAEGIEAPPAARIKDRLVVSATVRSQRFLNEEVAVYLKIDGKIAKRADRPGEDVLRIVRIRRPEELFENIVLPPAILPDTPGDYKVSIWCEPKDGELTKSNNERSTYVTLHKDGLSVLYMDSTRVGPRDLNRALLADERITLYPDFLWRDPGTRAKEWQARMRKMLEASDFDVFIIGDRSAKWFEGTDGTWILNHIRDKVENHGKGLLMIGGEGSFASGGWQSTPITRLLPVAPSSGKEHFVKDKETRQPEPIRFLPTHAGLTGEHKFILSVVYDPDPKKMEADNAKLYERLEPLSGGNILRRSGPDAVVLATVDGTDNGDPLLLIRTASKGRAAAMAVDTTFQWIRPRAEDDPLPGTVSFSTLTYSSVWRQLILWLARQDKAQSSLRVELERREFRAGQPQTITAHAVKFDPATGKGGEENLPNIDVRIVLKRPDGSTVELNGITDEKGKAVFPQAGTSAIDTTQPGEYEVALSSPKHSALGIAYAHFNTFQDDAETQNRSTFPKLAEELARRTGGRENYHGGLAEVLELLKPDKSRILGKSVRFPEWDEPNPGLQSTVFLVFVLLLTSEWLMRRLWGLV